MFKDIKNITGNIQTYNENILVLVNYNSEISFSYKTKLVEYKGHMLSEIMLKDLIFMERQALSDGIELVINNAYRNKNLQRKIYNDSIKKYQKDGYSYNEAKAFTEMLVSRPGYSEHETGLAIDFSESGNSIKNQEMWDWLKDNAYKYGFILRYPNDKVHITKIDFEPWHYRYVGKEAAIIIYNKNLSLEEYLLKEV
jgi:D-alanyl-D-alanine carboxypeptidase